ncbi:ATP-binding protein [Streptomyces sp. NPDC006617]|uniref:ATP-binding protein n=1 Tax=Streptomyces sp. NPDC006617 TaxID=3155354 RepID=UPI0033AB82E0
MTTERDPRHVNSETPPSSPRERLYRRERRSVPAARAFAREALADWGVRGRADDVVLCVSELATNALVHGVPAVPLDPDGSDEGGRGLLLVSELADKWGVTEREPGKVVWFECVVPAD